MGSSIFTYDGDFSNDNFEMASGFVTFKEMDKPSNDEQREQSETELIKAKKINKNKILIRVMTEEGSSSVNSNPLSLIHDLRPDLLWEYLGHETQGKMIVSFRMLLKIGVKQFTGEGKTKKLAKYSAARTALNELYGINLPDSCPGQTKTIIINAEESLLLDQSVANMIGFEIINKSKSIFDLLTETKKWTVLAGIVLKKEDDPNWFDIICITTGTKCVKGDCLSMTGSVLHDTHAEVLARRCFIHYLYKQLADIMDFNFQDRPEFILERKDDGYGFRLKEGIKVHLFISTAPCGDARVFSPKEENEIDAHANRLSRGLLRAKIESGEGTIPVKRERSTLTWDGVLQGQQRLQFMSCSDKIALWNVVGIQGSLLSHFIEPIYLESVVLQSLFNYDHLVRALHGRLNLNFMSDSLKKVSCPYKVNKSKVSRAQVKDQEMTRQITRSPNYAINWIKDDAMPEVISCDTGKTHKDEKTSRLAKQTFFSTFRTLLGRNLPKLVSSPLGGLIPTIYRDAKTSSQMYQVTKLHAVQAFSEQNLGDWIQVPAEVDLFGI